MSRLHRAPKAAPRVAVYSHKDGAALLAALAAGTVHGADQIEIYALEREFLAALTAHLMRRSVSTWRSPSARCTSPSTIRPSAVP